MTDVLAGVDVVLFRQRIHRVLDCSPDDITVETIHGGRSNLTYRVRADERSWVLRRPPLGHVLETAHDMGREFYVLSALYTVGTPVPRPVHFESDAGILGVPFFIMEFVEGDVIRTKGDAERMAPSVAAQTTSNLVNALVGLHSVDPDEAGLGALGRPDGYLVRQVTRWVQQWKDSEGHESGADLDGFAVELLEKLPSSVKAGVVHGDYRIDNTVLDSITSGGVAAVLDWEMSTIGDPWADLGLLLTYWRPTSQLVTGHEHPISGNPGFGTVNDVISLYESRAQLRIDNISWYVAFGHLKLAGIAQTIHARVSRGLSVGQEVSSAGEAVGRLVEEGRLILKTGDF